MKISAKLHIALLALSSAALVAGCGGSDGGDDPSSGDSTGGASAGGSGGVSLGGAGSASSGGSESGGSGGAGAGGSGAGGGTSGGCANDVKHATSANHIIADVSWPSKTGIEAGSGKIHIWTLSVLDFGAPDPATGKIPATGEVHPCGSFIPELSKSAIAGGGKVQTVIADDVWDKPGMPAFTAKGALSGFDVGATIEMDPVVSLVGLSMSDPNGPWPSSAKQVTAVDPDGDGQPGIKAMPRTDAPFSPPPTSLFEALNPNGKRALELYLVTRTAVALGGSRDTCTTATGAATVQLFDSHVVGCKRNDGKVCSGSESDFIDQNQPKYTIQSATYEMVQLPDGASCADARNALPM
jgi:hypothetical protein